MSAFKINENSEVEDPEAGGIWARSGVGDKVDSRTFKAGPWLTDDEGALTTPMRFVTKILRLTVRGRVLLQVYGETTSLDKHGRMG
jgi:hypothetical protein